MTTPQDVERLSAYLDHQLSPAEKTRLEARLRQEPELKAALADLQTTARLLHGLPTLTPPRNFTLSPSQVSKLSQTRPIFVKLRLTTAMATLALVGVIGGDLLSNLSLGFGGAAAPVSQGAAVKMEPTAAGAGVSSGAQDNFAGTEAPMAAEATLALPSPSEEQDKTNTPEAIFSAPAATLASTDERTLAYTAALTQTPTAALTSTSVGVAESLTLPPPVEIPTQPVSTLPALPASPLPLVRYVEVGLGLLIILLTGAAWLTRKG